MKRLVVIAILVLVGCSPTAVKPVTIRGGESSLTDLPAGSYAFAWTSECTDLQLSWAPTSGGSSVEIPVDGPSGSAVVAIPGGKAYLNGGGLCPSGGYVVTITPAAGPS